MKKLSCWFQVFCEEYNLSFHEPLKDACGKCTAYDLLPVDERTPELTEERELHRTEAATISEKTVMCSGVCEKMMFQLAASI